MKKLLFIIIIFLTSAIGYGQAFPCHSVCQTNSQRAFMKQSLDSAKKVWKIEFLEDATKADDAMYAKLPAFRKGTLDSLDKLNFYLKQVTTPPVDTSWKAIIAAQAKAIAALEFKVANPDVSWTLAVASQQKLIEAQAKLITDLAAQLSELKLWADKVKLINFK